MSFYERINECYCLCTHTGLLNSHSIQMVLTYMTDFSYYCVSQDTVDADDGEEAESPVESPEAPPSFSRVLYISGDKQEVTGMGCACVCIHTKYFYL